MSRQTPTDEEYYAYELIRRHFDFGELILSDKPDIISQNNLYGIEVVSALLQDEHKEIACLTKIAKGRKLKDSDLQWYRNNCCDYRSYSSAENDAIFLVHISQAIQEKVVKAAEYQKVQSLGLFITTHLIADPKEQEQQYVHFFKQHQETFNFLIFEIRNESMLLYIDKEKVQWIDYSDYQGEIARASRERKNQTK